jgi:hypothetical protein
MVIPSAAPRAIVGSIGSRIRLIFGDSGSEWLLLLNQDDGKREFQTRRWSNIPDVVAQKINDCCSTGQYIQEIDFGGPDFNPMWYMEGIKRNQTDTWWSDSADDQGVEEYFNKPKFRVSFGTGPGYFGEEEQEDFEEQEEEEDDEDEGVFWYHREEEEKAKYIFLYGRTGYKAHCNQDLLDHLNRINGSNKEFYFVRLFFDDKYFISDEEGTQWLGVGEYCGKELKKNKKVEEVAVARDGSWVVIFFDDYSVSVNVNEDLKDHLREFFARQQAWNEKRAQEITNYNNSIEQSCQAQEIETHLENNF